MGEEPVPVRPVESIPTPATAEDDPAVLRAEIAESRAELAETIDAIQDKLNPQRIATEVKQTVRDATVGKVTTMMNTVTEKASDIGEQVQDQAQQAVSYVRDNPLPALLVGAGVAWLLMRARGFTSTSRGPSTQAPSRSYGTTPYPRDPFRRDAPLYGRRAEQTLERWLRENPLTVGAVALAAGAVVGLGLPRTRTEDEWMGEARDTVVHRVQETAQQAVDKVTDVAEQVQQSAGDVQQAASGVREQIGGTTPGTETSTTSTTGRRTSGAGRA